MLRVLTAVLGLLLVISGGVPTPSSRLQRTRESACVVWIDKRGSEQTSICEDESRFYHVRTKQEVEHPTRSVSRTPFFNLFQRPPPLQS